MTSDERAFRETVQPLTDVLDGQEQSLTWPNLAAALDRLVSAASTVLHVDSVGVMLVGDADRARVVGASDALASALEQSQIDSGQGPGVDSLRTGKTVAVDDLAVHSGYRQLWRGVQPTGLRAVLSSPINVSDSVVGNFNAALRQPHAWTSTQIRANDAYACVIGVALGVTARATGLGNHVAHLHAKLALSGGSSSVVGTLVSDDD